jgi:pyrimidine-specific ribonucleoside hydrolase
MVEDEEWRLVKLTNEIHGHTGIYSIIGTKMGLYARELLGERPSVLSFAGKTPPLSCLNDGIQIGSGATLGRGLIEVAAEGTPCAKARFSFGERSFTLQLKEEYARRIRADISQAEAAFGHTPAYWERIEAFALQYWHEWDRREIFDCLAD